MKTLFVSLAVGASALVYAQHGDSSKMMTESAAATYEHLATAIIEIRATENNLVQGILMHHYALASRNLAAAAEGGDMKSHLEEAAAAVTNIANEGDKQVQAVRQRLLKAGHHHHTDSETQDDYIFVDSKEKKELLALAGQIAKVSDAAGAKAASGELDALFHKTMVED